MKRYLAYLSAPGLLQGDYLGLLEGCTSLHDAAHQAATMLLCRAAARQVAALSQEKGVFIASGRCGWVRYKKGEAVREIRFLLVAERVKGAKAL